MNTLQAYIIEKLHLDKDINVNLNKEDNQYVKILWTFLKEHNFFDLDEDEYSYDIKENYQIKLYLPEECNAISIIHKCIEEIQKMLDKENIGYKHVYFIKRDTSLVIQIN